MKYLMFELEDGSVYRLPLAKVAEHRAKYYAENDKDTTYQEEFDYVMEDDYEGIDWFQNNMDPDDFEESDYELVAEHDEKDLFEMIKDSIVRIGGS